MIIEVLKNIEHIKQLEFNFNLLEINGDTKSVINYNKESKFINAFLNPYLNTVKYKQTYNKLDDFIKSGVKYNSFDNYHVVEDFFIKEYVKKPSNDFIIKNLLDYDQLLLVNNAAIGYIKELNSKITMTLQFQTELYNY